MAKPKDINITLQEMTAKTAKELQKMVNSANKQALDFNAQEAKKVRDYNTAEANTARDFNAKQAELERQFNSAEAEKARKWQEQMSNTAHQREVKDLRKAGLNPVLSANTGAQSYTTSSASAGSASAQNASANNASGSVDSGAGAIGSLMSSLMSSMASLANTQASAKASLDSAKISGQYALKSAQTSANAQKYVADMNYKAQMDKPQSSVVSLIDKYFGSDISNATGASKKTVASVLGNLTGRLPSTAYGFGKDKNGKKVAFVAQGRQKDYDKSLRILGIEPKKLDDYTRTTACYKVLDIKFGNDKQKKSALSYLKKLANKNPNKSKTISSTSPFKGNNWNPYG